MQFKPMACGFHSHSDQSLDGASSPAKKIIRADQLGRIADCLTDHGLMSGLANHWFDAIKLAEDGKTSKKIVSIHGIEAYVVDEVRGPKTLKNGTVEPRYVHLTFHFKTKAAYQYFCRLTPKMENAAIVKVGESKPLLNLKDLEPIADQITLGSGCLVGHVMKSINDFDMTKDQRYETAEASYLQLANLVGRENFYVEVFPHQVQENWKSPVFDKKNKKLMVEHGRFVPILEKNHVCSADCVGVPHFQDECGHQTIVRDLQKSANHFVIDMAKKHKHRILISEDSHFANESDKLIQEVRLGNGKERWKFSQSYKMADSNEWATNLKNFLGVSDRDIEEWIDNSYHFVEQFKNYTFETEKTQLLLPTTEMVYGIQPEALSPKEQTRAKFWELVAKHGKMPKEDDPRYPVYKARVDYELSVMIDNPKKDFMPYFFIIEDCAEYAKKNGVTFTCRGSAAGSLCLFLLGVSIADPIYYKLPFERFLTLGRILSGSMPDVDMDWEDRDIILRYLRRRYGDDRIGLISSNMLLRLKSSILDVERSTLGSVRDATAKMCKNIEGAGQGVSDKDWLFGYKDKTTGEYVPGFWDDKEDEAAAVLRQYAKANPQIWETTLACIGVVKSKGVHAGGVVITPTPIYDYFPVIKTDEGWATAYEMKAIEAVGGVKYDMLGVKTLMALGIAIRSIAERTGKQLVWGELPHDPMVYKKIIHENNLASVFQLHTPTVSPYVLRIKPTTIEECAITTALIRPGALDAPSPDSNDPYTGSRTGSDSNIHAAEYFVRCREGRKSAYYIHPDLQPILGETYGVIVYQEQVLEMFRFLAEYSYEMAEEVRRAVGKKDAALLEKHLSVLKAKLYERGWTEQQATQLIDSIFASSRYSFNKSHSICYAIVAYHCCYIKHHYPLDYWKGMLTTVTQKHDKLKKYMRECNVKILPVDVQMSHVKEWTIEGDALRPPLGLIKKCGATTVGNLKRFMTMSLVDFYYSGVDHTPEPEEQEQDTNGGDD